MEKPKLYWAPSWGVWEILIRRLPSGPNTGTRSRTGETGHEPTKITHRGVDATVRDLVAATDVLRVGGLGIHRIRPASLIAGCQLFGHGRGDHETGRDACPRGRMMLASTSSMKGIPVALEREYPRIPNPILEYW